MTILINKARCRKCGDVITSTHRHDFKWCSCKSIAVDGGKSYLKRCGEPENIIELSEEEESDSDLDERLAEPAATKPHMEITAITRAEHLRWCKSRALEYLTLRLVTQAFTSMACDLGKHPETKGHIAIQLGFSLLAIGDLSSVDEMRKFIEGFN